MPSPKFECPIVLGCEVGCRAAWLYAVKQKNHGMSESEVLCLFFCYKFIPDSDCGKQKCISEAERECKYAIVVPCKLIVAPPSQMADVITINNFSKRFACLKDEIVGIHSTDIGFSISVLLWSLTLLATILQ